MVFYEYPTAISSCFNVPKLFITFGFDSRIDNFSVDFEAAIKPVLNNDGFL
jgi:hypothetical protein